MTHYVLGFAFSLDGTKVVLVRKNRGPINMAGKLNGVGGHVELLESYYEAMDREGLEELGVKLTWTPFTYLTGDGFTMWCFRSEIEDSLIYTLPWKNDVGEEILIPEVAHLDNVVPNLRWLIPMALESDSPIYYINQGNK